MEFNFVVGRYKRNRRQKEENAEHVLGGFLSLEKAKQYAEDREFDILDRGFMFIDSPEGRYIYGEASPGKYAGHERKWYAPGEIKNAVIYDADRNRNVSIDAYLPLNDYRRFIKGSNSVLDKLKDNKDTADRKKADRETGHERQRVNFCTK